MKPWFLGVQILSELAEDLGVVHMMLVSRYVECKSYRVTEAPI
jgi:hypothetical protein